MKKPEQNPLMNFRIKKETKFGRSKYYPQQKILWWWVNIFKNDYNDGWFMSLELAQESLCYYIAENKVEYLEVDCRKCEETFKTVSSTPDPPTNVV